MLPATRTPEGEPFRCEVCGTLNRVDVSRPLGDSVCVACGSFALVVNHKDALNPNCREVINASIDKVFGIGKSRQPLNQVGLKVARELSRCLAARGVRIHLAKKPHWWSWRLGLNVVAAIGELPEDSVAQKVIRTKREVMQEVTCLGGTTLFIAVPVSQGVQLKGVIEVIQRTQGDETTRKGYLKYLQMMAEAIAPCEV